MRRVTLALLLAALLTPLAGCGGDEAGTPDAGAAGADAAMSVDAGPCAPTPVKCATDVFQDLNLFDAISPSTRTVTNVQDGAAWVTTVDATAGGMSPTEPYVYARFTDQGMEKLSLSDVDALQSMDWDLGFRRYVIRMNGGDSGPSCVFGTQLPGNADFASYTSVAPDTTWYVDDYFTDNCGYISDSALGGPQIYLSGYWAYSGCVKMTGAVFVLQLRSGRHVKMTVLSYYATDQAQQTCNTTGGMPTAPGGTIKMRWAFVD